MFLQIALFESQELAISLNQEEGSLHLLKMYTQLFVVV